MKRRLFIGGSLLLLSGLAVLFLNSRSSSQDRVIFVDDEPAPLNPVIGTLTEGPLGARARTPAYQFDSGRPLVIEYMELQGQYAERLSDEQLELEIAELRATLAVMDADDNLDEIRQSLRSLIENHPETPAAEAAQRALRQLEEEEQFDPFFGPGPDPGF